METEMKQTAMDDPVTVAGDVYKLVMENDRVRVMDFMAKPGQRTAMHWHPDNVVYALSDYSVRIEYPDGRSREGFSRAGHAFWRHAGVHAFVNTGSTDARALIIEVKEPEK
jgi:hypothetical protein